VAVAQNDRPAAVATPQPPLQEPPAVTATPAPSSQNAIEAIAVSVETGRVLIRVRSAAPLTAAPAEFVVASPPRIVLDFPHTVTGLGRHHEVGEGDLQSVDVIEGESRTRLILILRNGMRHAMQLDRNELLITLTPVARSGN
jgi:type IV pilus assembly protein PilQ